MSHGLVPVLLGTLLATQACSEEAVEVVPTLPAASSEAGAGVRITRTVEHADSDGVAAFDGDGDGTDELVLVHEGVLSREGHDPVELGGAFQLAVTRGLPGTRAEHLVLASGMGRQDRDAPMRLWQLDGDSTAQVFERGGDRNQVTDLRVLDGRLWVAAFTDRWNVGGGWFVDGTWQPTTSQRLGTAQLPLDDDTVIVGRLYGDLPKTHGMLLRVDSSGATTRLPSLRGVRSLGRVDLDGDGKPELLAGDGWHHAYGEHGLARLLALPGDAELDGDVVGHTLAVLDGDYTINEVAPLPLGDGVNGLLLTGSHHLWALVPHPLGWSTVHLADISEVDNAVVREHADGRRSVVVSGSPTREIFLELTP